MKIRPNAAFTLIEIITAMAIVLVLVGLVVSIAGIANRNSALSRAKAEINMIESACKNYKGDFGSFPQDYPDPANPDEESVTDDLSPKKHFNPTKEKYALSGLFLYKELSGDKKGGQPSGGGGGADGEVPDGVPDEGEKRYLSEIKDNLFKVERDQKTNAIKEVKYIQDPFGHAYGYSTAGLHAEQKFQKDLRAGKSGAKRETGADLEGFNTGMADIWSTGGSKPVEDVTDPRKMELEWNKWQKNW